MAITSADNALSMPGPGGIEVWDPRPAMAADPIMSAVYIADLEQGCGPLAAALMPKPPKPAS